MITNNMIKSGVNPRKPNFQKQMNNVFLLTVFESIFQTIIFAIISAFSSKSVTDKAEFYISPLSHHIPIERASSNI